MRSERPPCPGKALRPDHSEDDPETVLLNDGDYVILMYEFYGG